MIIHLDALTTNLPLKLVITRTLRIIIKLAMASFVLLIARREEDNQVVCLIGNWLFKHYFKSKLSFLKQYLKFWLQ